MVVVGASSPPVRDAAQLDVALRTGEEEAPPTTNKFLIPIS